MCNTKRLGQTAALLLAGMAVGLAGGAYAADSTVPKEWNVNSNFKLGASLQAFDTKPAWVGALGEIEAVSAGLPSGRANAWFTTDTTVLNMTSDSVIATNTLIADDSSVVSFAVDPVYVDARVKFVVLADAPSTTGAKLAIYASAADTLKVVHNSGTATCTLTGEDLTNDWHQLTVKLDTDGTFDVLVDDEAVTGAQGLTLIGGTSDKTLDQIELSGRGKLDQLYVSHGNPDYSGTMGAIPTAFPDVDVSSTVTNWLAHLIYDSVITTDTTFSGFDKPKLDAAYLLDELNVDGGVATPVEYTFGVSAIDLVTPTLVKVTCQLTVDTVNKEDTINGRIRLLGKATIGEDYETMSPDAISPKNTDFNGGVATYDFTVPSGTKFFTAQIVE